MGTKKKKRIRPSRAERQTKMTMANALDASELALMTARKNYDEVSAALSRTLADLTNMRTKAAMAEKENAELRGMLNRIRDRAIERVLEMPRESLNTPAIRFPSLSGQ